MVRGLKHVRAFVFVFFGAGSLDCPCSSLGFSPFAGSFLFSGASVGAASSWASVGAASSWASVGAASSSALGAALLPAAALPRPLPFLPLPLPQEARKLLVSSILMTSQVQARHLLSKPWQPWLPWLVSSGLVAPRGGCCRGPPRSSFQSASSTLGMRVGPSLPGRP